MRVCLFEDRGAAYLEPLTCTRPVFDLLCGQSSLASKQTHYFAPCTTGTLIRPHLADCSRQARTGTTINDLDWLRADTTVLVNGRWLPPAGAVAAVRRPLVAVVGEEVAYAVVGPEHLAECSPHTIDSCLQHWKDSLPRLQVGGVMIHYPWDLVERNPEQLCQDFQELRVRTAAVEASTTLAVVGPRDLVRIHPTARLDPMVVTDTTHGPVVIDREAVIHAFSRLEGPCYIGPQAQVLGAKVRAGTTLGPQCRVGGEIETSIVHAHSNKYHDGFLGHSYVGEWVNLGAGTSNSDLRNDYGEITVILNGEPVKTGLNKVGCFLGDHTKTGLGTMLNTGSNIGVFCNLLPAGPLLPKYVPPFTSWWNGTMREVKDLAELLETAATVMRRRGCALTHAQADLYRTLFEKTAPERKRAVHEAEYRRMRRSA